MTTQYVNRFKDAPWYLKSVQESVLLVGTGGIGSNSLYCLTKTIPAKYWIIDPDIVEEHNIGTQFFKKGQTGRFKVEAIVNNCQEQADCNIQTFNTKYTNEYFPITITGLDNMKTRRKVFEEWRKHEDREILIEGRLRANLYEVYIVTKGREEQYEKTLFNDSDIDDGPCTFKQTAYFGMLIGARITHALVNYFTNKYSGDETCNLPFKIQEFGEPFYFNAE
jgi:molybdopterin/thiamine biosynthesis adenylyltransferase